MPVQTVERFSPEDAVLVVVDVQNDFCHPEGSASRAGFDISPMEVTTKRLVEVLEAARAGQIPVVFVRTTHDGLVDSPEWSHRLQQGIGPGYHPSSPNCVTGSWGAEFFHVSPEDGEAVVTKHRYSAFEGTNLDHVLRSIGRRSLVFTGFTTNVCVETSLRDGLCRDYLVSIVADACAAFDPDEHTAALTTISRYFGAVVDGDTLIKRWSA